MLQVAVDDHDQQLVETDEELDVDGTQADRAHGRSVPRRSVARGLRALRARTGEVQPGRLRAEPGAGIISPCSQSAHTCST